MLRYVFTFAITSTILSSTWSLPHPLLSITSQNVHLVPSLAAAEAYICRGGLQVDLRDSSRFLISVCTSVAVNRSAAIGTLPVNNLQGQVSVIVGVASANTPAPGDWDGMVAKMPQYFHQTSDGKRVLFVDDNSCVRELDRNARTILTVIGKGTCGSRTLDLPSAVASGKFVYGMAYEESTLHYYLSVANLGVYVYKKTAAGSYQGTLIIDKNDQSSQISIATRQLNIHGGYLWQKVKSGLNRYQLSGLDLTQLNRFDNRTFVRFLSSPGAWSSIDPTAKYQYKVRNLQLGVTDVDLTMSPDGRTLLVADLIEDRLFFVDTNNGDLSVLCKRGRGAPVDGDATTCTFVDIKAAVWLTEYQILVYEGSTNVFRKIRFMIPTTTSTTTTQVSSDTSASTVPVSTAKSKSQSAATPNGGPSEDVIIAVAVSVGALAAIGSALGAYFGVMHWRKKNRVNKISLANEKQVKGMEPGSDKNRQEKMNAATKEKPVVKKPTGGRNFTVNHHR